jgi:FSR family fosmidomycin resistance protein-like MFS transporter
MSSGADMNRHLIHDLRIPDLDFWKRHSLLLGSSLMHVVNDAAFVAIYPLLPAIAREFGLSLVEVGTLKTLLSFSSSIFQIPAALLSERVGDIGLLALGMGWVSVGFGVMAAAGSFFGLMVLTLAAGLGGASQHPVATSAVSRAYGEKQAGTAIGLLNFSGDVGKILAPLAVGLLLLFFSWRTALVALGLFGTVFSLLFWQLFRERQSHTAQRPSLPSLPGGTWGILDLKRFLALSLIGVLDGSTRSTLLTFTPFLLTVQKGFPDASASFMLSVLLVGGACGKFGCGFLTDRLGVVKMIVLTEFLTASFILCLLTETALWTVPLFLGLGFALNGTSTVLYTSVARLIDYEKRARGYGLFYTIYLVASALAPVAYGILGSLLGLTAIFVGVSIATFLILPLALVSFRD